MVIEWDDLTINYDPETGEMSWETKIINGEVVPPAYARVTPTGILKIHLRDQAVSAADLIYKGLHETWPPFPYKTRLMNDDKSDLRAANIALVRNLNAYRADRVKST